MFEKYALTELIHKGSYAAISPLRPELSQAGRTVVITGGGSGIGYGIAQAFVKASAARVIILGRRADVLAAAAERLAAEAAPAGSVVVEGIPCDIASTTAVDALWDRLRTAGTVADVLVLNAAGFSASRPLLDVGTAAVWRAYDENVRAQLQLTEHFYKQEGKGASETKNLVHVSTASIHAFTTLGQEYLSYGLTKHAGQLTLQLIAQDTLPNDMQIVSFHPGAIFTAAAKGSGWTEDSLPWDHIDLPSHFAVWAASPEAQFLHGRFVWASWDVEQLKNGDLRKRIDEDPTFLKLGVNGL
ncbi:NAD(P)-binding protein [Nemania diffusa]|nr:NAD(P)-binding protein [Nemania diffusa]